MMRHIWLNFKELVGKPRGDQPEGGVTGDPSEVF